MEKQIGLGIVGYGGFGEFTAQAYASMPQVRIVAITDVDAARRGSAAELYHARAYEDLTALLADPEVDIVAINTPPWLHASQAMAAAEAGKHIFLEKPLAVELDDADTLLVKLKERRVHLTIDYVLRHVPVYETLLKVTNSGLLGAVTYMRLENVASNEALHDQHWFWQRSRSGGIFIEHGVHFFDLCNQISGARPVHVSGAAHLGPNGRQDRVMAAVTYANGTLANFYHAFDRPAILEQTVLRVVLERGSIVVSGWIPDHLELEGTVPAEQRDQLESLLGVALTIRDIPAPVGITGATPGQLVQATLNRADRNADYVEAVTRGMADFVTQIQQPHYTPLVTLQDAYESFRLAFLAQRSIDDGCSLEIC
ncbi:hypothetical protein KDH_20440 [Dictyobacter sp. S3.2.2.5]|uniref:Oxidoreductase n=1 Tax=Dictyobacter halimunensis TaxID=3026934 RepID=A0ABQ6FND4_9CHLR|nr:hypothetical protein KDH_20440 [Dictyobacter sp. S3.2.2.5]